jgi:hypothetical protein
MDTTVPGVKSLLVRARIGLLDSAAVRESPRRAPKQRRTGNRARQRRGARTVSYSTALAAATVARGAAA